MRAAFLSLLTVATALAALSPSRAAAQNPYYSPYPQYSSDLTDYQRQYYDNLFNREAFRLDLEQRRYYLRGLGPYGNYYPRTFYGGTRGLYYGPAPLVDPYYVPPYLRSRVYYYRY
jgi:hypothetical protein